MTHIIGGVGGKVRYWMLRHGGGTGFSETGDWSRLVKCGSVCVWSIMSMTLLVWFSGTIE